MLLASRHSWLSRRLESELSGPRRFGRALMLMFVILFIKMWRRW